MREPREEGAGGWREGVGVIGRVLPLSENLFEEAEYLRDVQLHIFKIQKMLIVLLLQVIQRKSHENMTKTRAAYLL